MQWANNQRMSLTLEPWIGDFVARLDAHIVGNRYLIKTAWAAERAPWAVFDRFGSPRSASNASPVSTTVASTAGVSQSGRVANRMSSVAVLPLAPGARASPRAT